LEPGEFIRRFLMHVLPKGFHRIRHYGLLANGGSTRAEKLARACELIAAAPQIAPSTQSPHNDGTCEDTTLSEHPAHRCPHCGSRMVMIETFEPGRWPRHRPSAPIPAVRINTSCPRVPPSRSPSYSLRRWHLPATISHAVFPRFPTRSGPQAADH